MSKVSVIILPFRKPELIKPVFDAIFNQTHQDLEVIAVINDSADGSKEIIAKEYSAVKIIDVGFNAMFAKGNNIGIKASTGEFIQLVNDDLLLEPNYIEEMLKVFENPKVGSATGKLLRYNFKSKVKTNIIDSTGIVINVSGRARDRGQLEADYGQYDDKYEVFGVSGAGPMYRRSALERVRYQDEYFDEDFQMYWEDVDLAWRFVNAKYVARFVDTAVAYHGRTAGQSSGGYLHLLKFILHHKQLNPQVLKWNYKNHILMYIKNAQYPYHPAFLLRELAMLGYILIFETSTLKAIPELFHLIPKIWAKEKPQEQLIQTVGNKV